MPDDLEIPAELIGVYRAWWTAHRDVTAYEAGVSSERRALFPDPDGRGTGEAALRRREWPPEQVARLAWLRALCEAALHDLTAHPLSVQAQHDGTWTAVSAALQKTMQAEQNEQDQE